MGNSLLDFVMALVRDPDAAARYAADPGAALAAAELPEVTAADVANLLPMVADSLAAGSPDFIGAARADATVWTSKAAAVAFEAFGPAALPGAIAAPVPAGAGPAGPFIEPPLDAGPLAAPGAAPDPGTIPDPGVPEPDPVAAMAWEQPPELGDPWPWQGADQDGAADAPDHPLIP